MELFEKYQSALAKNRQISISGDLYSGYLTPADREAMAVVFKNFSDALQSVAQKLENTSAYIAKNASIETFNWHNKVTQQLNEIINHLGDEMEKDLYRLTEIPIQGAFDLLQKDNHVIQGVVEFRNECKSVLQNRTFDEHSLIRLYELLTDVEIRLQERHSEINSVATTSKELHTKVNEIGSQIDKHQLESLQSNIDAILINGTGMTRPQYELINMFKERQLFIYRRAERAIERDENAIIVFEAYLKLLKRIQSYIEENDEILSFGSKYVQLKQAIEGIPRIQERLDTLYHISGTKQHKNEEKQHSANTNTEKTKKTPINNRLMLISAATVALVAIVIGFLL